MTAPWDSHRLGEYDPVSPSPLASEGRSGACSVVDSTVEKRFGSPTRGGPFSGERTFSSSSMYSGHAPAWVSKLRYWRVSNNPFAISASGYRRFSQPLERLRLTNTSVSN